jgi:hypothetical protein
VAKTAAQLEREIARSLGLPPAVTKKWKTKVAAYKRAIVDLESGYSEEIFRAAVRARDALDKAIYEATAHVPYDPAKPAHTSDAIQALERERKELVSSTWTQAQERGHEANRRRHTEEVRRLREEEREARRPYDWMRR